MQDGGNQPNNSLKNGQTTIGWEPLQASWSKIGGPRTYNKSRRNYNQQSTCVHRRVSIFCTQTTTTQKMANEGEREIAKLFIIWWQRQRLQSFALGNSVGTGKQGIVAEVLEVTGELDEGSQAGWKSKEKLSSTTVQWMKLPFAHFTAYGGAKLISAYMELQATEYGAVGVLIRSMGLGIDTFAHTGTLVYKEGLP